MKEIKWISVEDQEPDNEVLAIGYQGEMLIGYVGKDESGEWTCESNDTVLEEVTHWIDLKTLKALPR
jgi:hypothetical protein